MARPQSVFVSKPNALNKTQSAFWERLAQIFRERGLTARTLGETDYPNSAPLEAVRQLVAECDGAIVLGLSQLEVTAGTLKKGTESAKTAAGTRWPTAWNQIEAAMAYAFGKPLFIVREPPVEGGVFDIGSSDRFIHQAELSHEWLASDKFLQPFNEWLLDVQQRP